VILSRAGLSLDLPAMWRLRWPASRLAFAPSTAEALVVTLVAKPLLGLPWGYAATLGFLFAAISPAVVIPSLLSLHEKGFGAEAGVATLVVTAASVDVVYAIAGFGVCSSLLAGAGAGAGAAEEAWRAPVQLLAGVAGGAVLGAALGAVTSSSTSCTTTTDKESGDDKQPSVESASSSPGQRAVGLLGAALAVLFAGAEADATGGAALAVIVMSAAAGRAWGSAGAKAVGAHLNALWLQLAQPLLFALIGAAVDLTRLSGDVVGKGLLVLFVGLVVRAAVAFLAAGGGHLGFYERVFVAVAWMPKATVQAALAGLPYDAAVASFGKDSPEAEHAEVLLALGVLAIAVTAPLGAAAVALSGERLLKRAKSEEVDDAGEEGGEASTTAGGERV
jgi:NhaP-type Na+/H+ or K+/H+ antiporter